MTSRDSRDIIGGFAMMAIGLLAAWHAGREYDIGTLGEMGPGYFPVALGALLAALGVGIGVPAFFRPGSPIKVSWATFALVSVSVVAFASLLTTAGLVVASLSAALISSVADHGLSWRKRGVVALCVAFLTWLIFGLGLGMSLPIWPWNV